MSRDTVGKIATDLQQKDPDSRDPIELQREMQKEWALEIDKAVKRGKKTIEGDFYIVVITKKERLLENVLRNYFFPRQSCPTPEWDQTVYKYNSGNEILEYLWTVPDKGTCYLLRNHANYVVPEERELLGFILDFFDGTLDRLAKKLNNEEPDSLFIQK